MSTHLTLHAFGSAGAGAAVGSLDRLRLGLLLQFEVLRVQVLGVSWTLQLLVELLNTLKKKKEETIQQLFFKNNKLAINVKPMVPECYNEG